MPVTDFSPFLLSLKLAVVTTGILLITGVPIAILLEYSDFRFKIPAEIVITLPMVLPPTVLGFYIMVLLSPRYGPGRFFSEFAGVELLFSFTGIVIASVIHSMPYMIQPVKSGVSLLGRSLIEASYTLGKSRLTTFLRVILPNIRPSIFTGMLMTFMHVTGEFGVVLMIGGSIPGRTRVASIALYEKVESMNFSEANCYALLLVALSVIMITILMILRNRLVEGRQ